MANRISAKSLSKTPYVRSRDLAPKFYPVLSSLRRFLRLSGFRGLAAARGQPASLYEWKKKFAASNTKGNDEARRSGG